MTAASVTTKVCCRSSLRRVNLSDIPELMPGAMSSANPAQRVEFESRCIRLHQEEMKAQRMNLQSTSFAGLSATSGAIANVDALEAMFPNLDSALVRVLASDAASPQVAMETLLALVAAIAEPLAAAPLPKDIGLEDIDAFPSLVDADGWQVAGQQQLGPSPDEDLGSAWCDRAKAIASTPAQRPAVRLAATVATSKKLVSKQNESIGFEMPQPETDYEYRQRLGKQRVQNRAQFGRGAKAVTSNSCHGADSIDVEQVGYTQLGETSGDETGGGSEQ